ncbi:MAG: class I SAM-dependent RNA methyltransferase, partial [Bacteroidetes bacterium]|nr:class I SAM-dependent RNA methyltransferase [Bacteroidota bacterium]
MKKGQLIESQEVVDIARDRQGVVRYDNMVIFIKDVVPGDLIDIRINKRRRRFWEGEVVKYHVKSSTRVDPFCSHFGTCGGCKWQHLSYETQLIFKHKTVKDNFERIGKIEFPEIPQVLPSIDQRYYRNKLEYTFSDKRWLSREEIKSSIEISDRQGCGFHIAGMFDKVLDIEKCYLQDDISNKVRLSVKEFALEQKIPFFNIRDQHGTLRNLIIRTSQTGELMVIVVSFEDTIELQGLMDHLE